MALLAAVLALPSASASETQRSDRLKSLSLEELGNLEVTTSSKVPEELRKTPAAVFVITQEDIRRSGAVSLPEVLRLAPGVHVARIDSNKWAIGIRGFTGRLSRSVLVLIDGRSVYTPLFAGVYWEMQDVLLEDIERIEVIRGPGGTIWGSNAVNGVINIITKSAVDTTGALVSAGGGNVEQGFLNARVGDTTGGGFSYRFYGKLFTRGPQYHPDGRNFDDWRRGQLGFRSDWKRGTRDSFTLQGDIYDSTIGNRINVSLFSPPSIMDVQDNSDIAGGNVMFSWLRRFSDRSDVQLQAYYDRTSREDINFQEVRNTFDIDFLHHFKVQRHDLRWGVGARVSPSKFTQVVPTVDFQPHDETYAIYSAFLRDQIELVKEKLTLTLGSKFEHTSYSGLNVQPSARLMWNPTTHHAAWMAVSRAVRTPSRVEENLQLSALTNPATSLFLRVIGDGNFLEERLTAYELGYRALPRPTLSFDVALFYNYYSGLLSLESRPAAVETVPPPSRLVLPLLIRNGLMGETMGFELAPAWEVVSNWKLTTAYSYLRVDMRHRPWSTDLSTVRQVEGASPRHQFRLDSNFNRGPFEFDLGYRYISALTNPVVRAYHTADVRGAWHLTPNWELSVAGRNLLQPHHVEFTGNPGPPVGIRRAVYGKVTFRK